MRDKVSAAYGDMPMPTGGNRVEFDPARFAAHAPASTSRPSRGSLALPALPGPGGPRPSMADTLRTTFGEGGAGAGRANDHIAAAYGKFRAFGL
jgi:hypothetical protein